MLSLKHLTKEKRDEKDVKLKRMNNKQIKKMYERSTK